MRPILALLAALTFLVPPSLSEITEVCDLQNHPFAVAFPPGQRLRMQLRSGEIRIKGRDDNKIAVHLEGRNADNAQDLTVRFKHFAETGDLEIHGGPKNDLEILIEIPKDSNLYVRMPYGELTLDGVSGDKDVELHAGDLSIDVGQASDYKHVDASVITGDISAAPFDENHGGLFRSFSKSGSGKFQLHAHVGAGDLVLR
jgi:hypothetical protein